MRVVNKEVNGRKLYYEQFSNYLEFLKIVEDRNAHNAHGEHTLEYNVKNRGTAGSGVKSYDEARNLLLNGWDKEVEFIKDKVSHEIDRLSEKEVVRQFVDVVGYQPIVANAVMNIPTCMINMRKEVKKSKIIKFLINRNVTWNVRPEELEEKFSKVLARIAILEKHGYRCRIEILQSYANENEKKTIPLFSVLIKSENQLLDIKRVAFPLVHMAMYRVYGFAWQNSLPIDFESYNTFGMGQSLCYWAENKRKAVLDALTEKNEKIVYIDLKSDLEKEVGGLK